MLSIQTKKYPLSPDCSSVSQFGPAGKQKDLSFNSASALLSLQKITPVWKLVLQSRLSVQNTNARSYQIAGEAL